MRFTRRHETNQDMEEEEELLLTYKQLDGDFAYFYPVFVCYLPFFFSIDLAGVYYMW